MALTKEIEKTCILNFSKFDGFQYINDRTSCLFYSFPVGNYVFKVSNKNTRIITGGSVDLGHLKPFLCISKWCKYAFESGFLAVENM